MTRRSDSALQRKEAYLRLQRGSGEKPENTNFHHDYWKMVTPSAGGEGLGEQGVGVGNRHRYLLQRCVGGGSACTEDSSPISRYLPPTLRE